MVEWECPTNPREASGLDPEAVHHIIQRIIEAFPNRGAMDTVTYITTDWLLLSRSTICSFCS